MRRVMTLVLTLLAFATLAAPESLAQSPTVQVQTCVIVLTAYGLIPVCTSRPVDANELERRASEYMTNGASVFAAPTAGPAGDYFHEGARYWAMPTTSWVPTFPPTPSSMPVLPPVAAPPAESSAASPAPAPASVTEPPEAGTSPATEDSPAPMPSATETTSSGAPPPPASAAASAEVAPTPPAPPSPPSTTTPESAPETHAPTPAPAFGSGRLLHAWWAWVVAAVLAGAALLYLAGSRLGERLRLRWR
jgi:hypothetical protein